MKSYLLNVADIEQAPEELDKYVQYLSLDRQERLQHCKPKQTRRLSIGAGLLLCYAYARGETEGDTETVNLAKVMQLLEEKKPTLPEMKRTENGKPYFVNPQKDGFFNLSHSGNFVFLVYDKSEVGCDIQREEEKQIDKIGSRFFGPTEKKLLELLPKQEKTVYFFTMWCSKEAMGKYLGQGMAPELEQDLAPQVQEKNVSLRVFTKPLEGKTYYFATCMERQEES